MLAIGFLGVNSTLFPADVTLKDAKLPGSSAAGLKSSETTPMLGTVMDACCAIPANEQSVIAIAGQNAEILAAPE